MGESPQSQSLRSPFRQRRWFVVVIAKFQHVGFIE
jgi:hypothetical protein